MKLSLPPQGPRVRPGRVDLEQYCKVSGVLTYNGRDRQSRRHLRRANARTVRLSVVPRIRLRGERGNHHLAEEHLADAIEVLIQTRRQA